MYACDGLVYRNNTPLQNKNTAILHGIAMSIMSFVYNNK